MVPRHIHRGAHVIKNFVLNVARCKIKKKREVSNPLLGGGGGSAGVQNPSSKIFQHKPRFFSLGCVKLSGGKNGPDKGDVSVY
jgi:hypothetical protein